MWLGAQFWDRLDRLEAQHRRVQSEHAIVRWGLGGENPQEVAELRNAWRRYCEVIAELDEATPRVEPLTYRPGPRQSLIG